ncbi:formate-dependent phosphoribosylglycinamide formyltransferase [Paenibacillus hamazuiensis]|uniref:formate-dependent phosphoribosylglycinamide formyltransferase n=1 Tax=Paenibacillus hamazuiensis TaxID=2936508 RepID=UPI00200BB002|nr:formate-dependent phosphoribosylglycinamide formyltransferase [Paenibacillus hamazuiensis]
MYGSPLSATSRKMMLLGSGELGKEVIIEAQRLGVETIAVDRYANAPAMQVAHRSYVINMLDEEALRKLIESEQPDLIVPEIEAIATPVLVELEQQGFRVIPTATASRLTMDREGIRRLAAETLGLPTARYEFADSLEELKVAVANIGTPCVIKPIMSSSGKGQSVCRTSDDVEKCWNYAMEGGRAKKSRVIVEEFIHFESEITLLTVRSVSGTSFCAPIGHVQKDGDYIESWQPHAMSPGQIVEAENIARTITEALGGAGIYGVELFLAKDKVYFSEVSPRPHDTGMVTMATQDLSEFALHVRAILGFPIPTIRLLTPGASHTLKAWEESGDFRIGGLEEALAIPNTQVRIFGKPETKVGRRMAVALNTADTVEEARARAAQAAQALRVEYGG